MLPAYAFSLVLGGAFLLVSVFGDVFHSDVSDLDLDVDTDVHFEVDHVGHGGDALKFLSLRSLVYALFGFGAVGTALTVLAPGQQAWVTSLAAIGSGIASGALITTVFNYLKASDSGAHMGDNSFVGLAGEVTVPLGRASEGHVTIERGGRRHTLRALPHDGRSSGPPEDWQSVVVVEMKGGVALVAPVADDLILGP